MGARTRKASVELVEVQGSQSRGPSVAAHPSRWRAVLWPAVVVGVVLAVGALAVTAQREDARRANAVAHLVAAGTYLADVDADVAVRWRVTSPRAEVLAVADGAVITLTELRGTQLLVARDLGTGAELWRSTFALNLGSSRCLGPEHATDAPLVVCALRARPRVPGVDDAGTALHVRDVRTGELLAERRASGALLGMRLVDGDLLGAWLESGTLQVRREDATAGTPRWELTLETLEPVASASAVGAGVAGGELVVATLRDAFAVTEDGELAFTATTAPPRQPRQLALRPVGEDLYAVWRTREREPADLVDADGGGRLAAIGTPRVLVSDDGSLGTVVLTRHPDGDLLWDVARRAKLWRAHEEVAEALVTDGVLALAGESGVRVVDPRRGVTLWRSTRVTGLVGVAGELVVREGSELVGVEARTGLEVWRASTDLAEGTRFAVVGGHLFALEPRSVTLLAAPGP
ncbi:MAG: PQQ-like beta-propeller repeat protein [Actinomycetales bacterium]|nr:PQQ-like beta-propeller repeat protein [Actinomycetales bacterium]